MTKFSDTVGADGLRREVWFDALIRHRGKIVDAANEYGFSRQRGWNLTQQLGLVDEGRRLREEARQERARQKSAKQKKE